MDQIFHFLHLISLMLLIATIAAACAAPLPERRKKILMWSGIASLVAVITGFGMTGIGKIGFPTWVNVKILCWLLISAIVGIPFRKPGAVKGVLIASSLGVVVAVYMVTLGRYTGQQTTPAPVSQSDAAVVSQ